MKHLLAAVILASAVTTAFPCEFTFAMIDSQGVHREIDPLKPVILESGDSYTLVMSYWEDHRNCRILPEETRLLLDGARWRVLRDTQPLILAADPSWEQTDTRTHEGMVHFTARSTGSWVLEVVRICDRAGFVEEIVILVTSSHAQKE